MPFRIHVTKDFDQMSQVAAGVVEDSMTAQLAERDSYVLGLATGNSPTGLYKHLAKAFNAGRLDARRVTTFNLDEYVGLPGENPQQRALHPESYSHFMITELFGLCYPRIPETNVPWGTLIEQDELLAALEAGDGCELVGTDKGRAVVISPDAEGYLGWIRDEVLDGYAKKIAAAGGIDLHVIGVGGRGHVAFHESGIPFDASPMLLVKLDEQTLRDAVIDQHFISEAVAPHFAISMGAELVFRARKVLMVANGPRKTGPVAEAVLGAVTPDVPLSYGQKYVADGGDLTFVLDEKAAAELLDRADEVAARGFEIIDHRGEPYESMATVAFYCAPQNGTLT